MKHNETPVYLTPAQICEALEAIDFYRSMNDDAADDITGNLQVLQDKLESVRIRAGVKTTYLSGRRMRFRHG